MGYAKRVLKPLSKVAIVDQETIDAIAAQVPPGGLTINQIKADSEIASAISLKHSIQDLSNLVVKETGKSLLLDTAITDLTDGNETNLHTHPGGGLTLQQVKEDTDIASSLSLKHVAGSDNQDLSGLQPKETGKSLTTNDLTNELKTGYDSAVTHAGSAHAPSNAQVNADITKAEIEAKLTGVISSHTHTGGSDPFATAKLVLAADKPTGANTTPVTLGLSFNYEANSKYVIDIYALVAPTAATTGCGFMIDVSTAVTYVGTFVSHQLAATGTLSGAGSIGDMAATSSGVSSGMVSTATQFVYGGGILITTSNAGTATFFFRSETTAVTTCKVGTMIRVMKMV